MATDQDYPTTVIHDLATNGDADRLQQEFRNGNAVHINATAGPYGRTPLMLAAIHAHIDAIKVLIEHGADVSAVDKSGMTATECAVMFGNLNVARYLKSMNAPSSQQTKFLKSVPIQNRRLLEDIKFLDVERQSPLSDKSMVVIYLGSSDARKQVNAVCFNKSFTGASDNLSLKLSCMEQGQTLYAADLSLKESLHNLPPIAFHATNSSEIELLFEIRSASENANMNTIGNAVFAYSSLSQTNGTATHTSLVDRDVRIPILDYSSTSPVGTLTFNTIVVKPFHFKGIASSDSSTRNQTHTSPPRQVFPPQSQDPTRTIVAGHRGLGKNSADRTYLQIGENTINSFNAAADQGATFVEFDVQVTSDGVPVIYHDFIVAETGADTPVHQISSELFLSLGKQSDSSDQLSSQQTRRSRALSDSNTKSIQQAGGVRESRMTLTSALTRLGFKANTPARQISGPFTTLSEVFQKVDRSLGFNIEVKYPTLDEAEYFRKWDRGAWHGIEINQFVDKVLNVVFEKADHSFSGDSRERQIYFSSFNPTICILLRLKQNRFPVMFLTMGGMLKGFAGGTSSDNRVLTLWDALVFVKTWGLDGIVSVADPFLTAPEIIRHIKEEIEERSTMANDLGTGTRRCAILSFGGVNNEAENVRIQIEEGGIDAVIVDRVGKIVKAAQHMKKPTISTGGE